MHKVIVIRHSDDDNQNSKYVANLQKNEDGSYSASVGVVKEDGYNDYVSKHGLHFTKALQEYASKQMVNSNNQEHTWTSEQVQNVCNVLNLKIPNTSTIEDVTYTANMAYADFYPELLNEHQCINMLQLQLMIKMDIQEFSFVDGWQTLQERRKIQIGINSNNL